MAKIRLGDTAPNFKAQTSEGKIDFYKFLGNRWGVLFSHPAYFTSISTTELGSKAKLKYEFEKRNVKVIALSVDSIENQQQWIIDLNESKRTEENFIIITDQNSKISKLYDFIRPNASATETESYVMIIAPDKTVKRIITYPAITERDLNETLHVIDSLQLSNHNYLVTNDNYKHGEKVVTIPDDKKEKIETKFPKSYKRVKPSLRVVPLANL